MVGMALIGVTTVIKKRAAIVTITVRASIMTKEN